MKMGWSTLVLAASILGLSAQPLLADTKALNNCKMCHDISPAKKKVVGPPLFGLLGAKPVISGATFAAWDDTNLEAFLANPKSVKSSTTMPKVSDAVKRAEIISALKELK